MEAALTPELRALEREVTGCRRCPRLVEWRERVARVRRRAFSHEDYWGRPVPGRAGFASRAESVDKEDGLRLRDCFVTAAVRCAPPGNRPTPAERRNCRPWLEAEIDRLPRVRVVVSLGGFAYDHALRIWRERGHPVPSPKPGFAHGREVDLGPRAPRLLASFRPGPAARRRLTTRPRRGAGTPLGRPCETPVADRPLP